MEESSVQKSDTNISIEVAFCFLFCNLQCVGDLLHKSLKLSLHHMSVARLLSATEDLNGMGAAVEAPGDLCAVGTIAGGDK